MLRSMGGTPKIHLEGSKLYCEHYSGEKTLEIPDSDKKIGCFILYGLDATLTIKGKPTSLFIDCSTFTKVILLDGANSIHVINSQRVEVVSCAPVSNINIERTHDCIIGLTDVNAEITVCGSSHVMLNLPKEENSENIVEIPTQIKTKIKQGKVHHSRFIEQ